MQVIAIEKMKEFLQANLRLFDDPVLVITSEYYAGCSHCNSDATIFRPELVDRNNLGEEKNLHQITDHKFPCDIFIKIPESMTVFIFFNSIIYASGFHGLNKS